MADSIPQTDAGPGAKFVPNGSVAVAYVLLGLYLLPSLLILVELWRTMALTESFILKLCFALANDRGTAMAELHQLILPVITGLSVATLKRDSGPAVWLLLIVCLGGFLIVLGAQALLDVSGFRDDLMGLAFTEAQIDGARSFLGVQRANLVLYFSVMAGLKATDPKPDQVKDEPPEQAKGQGTVEGGK